MTDQPSLTAEGETPSDRLESGSTPRTRCAVGQCPKAPRWLYIVEYNQDEGYVREQFCDRHADRNAPGWPERVELPPTPDRHLSSGVGWA